jgi:hypothetical protein
MTSDSLHARAPPFGSLFPTSTRRRPTASSISSSRLRLARDLPRIAPAFVAVSLATSEASRPSRGAARPSSDGRRVLAGTHALGRVARGILRESHLDRTRASHDPGGASRIPFGASRASARDAPTVSQAALVLRRSSRTSSIDVREVASAAPTTTWAALAMRRAPPRALFEPLRPRREALRPLRAPLRPFFAAPSTPSSSSFALRAAVVGRRAARAARTAALGLPRAARGTPRASAPYDVVLPRRRGSLSWKMSTSALRALRVARRTERLPAHSSRLPRLSLGRSRFCPRVAAASLRPEGNTGRLAARSQRLSLGGSGARADGGPPPASPPALSRRGGTSRPSPCRPAGYATPVTRRPHPRRRAPRRRSDRS